MYVHDVARELKRRGHEPAAYSPVLGGVAEMLRAEGIAVMDDLAELTFRPDIIHAHHHVQAMTALASLPGVPAVYFCHGTQPWEEMPPVFPRILRYAAVSAVGIERVVKAAGVPQEEVRLVLNFVDTEKFQPRSPLPPKPLRALVFSNYASEQNYLGVVREACGACGMSVEVCGAAADKPCDEPWKLLPEYDLIFAKGRAAIEALAVGCAVVLCDTSGLGPMVTTQNYGALRSLNFGLAALVKPLAVPFITEAIQSYDAADAMKVSQLIRGQADMRNAVSEIIRIYDEVISSNAQHVFDPVNEQRATGAYLQMLGKALKQSGFDSRRIAPPSKVPDSIALPAAKRSWLRRIFGCR